MLYFEDECFVISPGFPSLCVAEECRYIFETFYVDSNDNLVLSLNCGNKELDDKEPSESLFKTHSLPATLNATQEQTA